MLSRPSLYWRDNMSGGLKTSVTAFRTGLLILPHRTGNMATSPGSDIRRWNHVLFNMGNLGISSFSRMLNVSLDTDLRRAFSFKPVAWISSNCHVAIHTCRFLITGKQNNQQSSRSVLSSGVWRLSVIWPILTSLVIQRSGLRQVIPV
jgi:hypothetical protein